MFIFYFLNLDCRNKGWICNDLEEVVNLWNLTTDVTHVVLLTEPLVIPSISALIYFLWHNKIFFVRMQGLIYKNLCLLVPLHLTLFTPTVILESHKHLIL